MYDIKKYNTVTYIKTKSKETEKVLSNSEDRCIISYMHYIFIYFCCCKIHYMHAKFYIICSKVVKKNKIYL